MQLWSKQQLNIKFEIFLCGIYRAIDLHQSLELNTHWCLGRWRGRGPRWYDPRTASSASARTCPEAWASPGTETYTYQKHRIRSKQTTRTKERKREKLREGREKEEERGEEERDRGGLVNWRVVRLVDGERRWKIGIFRMDFTESGGAAF